MSSTSDVDGDTPRNSDAADASANGHRTASTGGEQILTAIERHGVLPVAVVDDVRHAVPLAMSLVSGGLPLAEVTLRTVAALHVIEAMSTRSDDCIVGAGTVLTREQVRDARSAGARFIVSPGLDPDVVAECLSLSLPVLPGVSTATEVQCALKLGISATKFFPAAAAGGTVTLKSLSAPFPMMRFLPTGGITRETLTDYLRLPAVLAVGGTWLATPTALQAGDFDSIAAEARTAVDLVATCRAGRTGQEQ